MPGFSHQGSGVLMTHAARGAKLYLDQVIAKKEILKASASPTDPVNTHIPASPHGAC
jgi:hypothetical protein